MVAGSRYSLCLSRTERETSLAGLIVWSLAMLIGSPPSSPPPRHDDLLVGVELVGVPSLGLQVAEEAVPRAAERELRHGRGDADVDADHRRGRQACVLARRLAAGGEDRRRVRVGMRTHDRDRL